MWILALLKRDFKIARRNVTGILLPIAFLMICASLFPLATDADISFLAKAGAPIILLSTLLASLLSLENIFTDDLLDATIDQMLISARPLSIIMLVRTFVHWLTTMLPMVILSPIPALMYGLKPPEITVLMLALLLTTPVLALLGTLGAAILTGTRQGNILLGLIVLPLYIPLMIFAGNAVAVARIGGSVVMNFYILGGFLFLSLALIPYASALAIRQATKYE
ncbi:MAG: heme exporter protein CcmB [Alphaproteobacteria bacterium]